MQSIDIDYSIQITLNDTIYSNEFTLTKDFSYTIESENNTLYGNYYTISKKYILDYFKEEIKEYLSKSDRDYDLMSNGLEIVSFELSTKTEGVDVYFESSDDSQYNFSPSIMAYVFKDDIKLQTPTLYCELLSANTIKWYFEDDGFAHYLYDENNKLIYNLGIGINYYIESDLKYETTYYRKIVAYNSEYTSKESNLAKITTEKENYDMTLTKFEDSQLSTKYPLQKITEPNEKLKAFHSGIGDFNDCKIKKNLSEQINLLVPLTVNVNMKTFKVTDFYEKVNFAFRETMKYNYIENIRTATLEFNVTAYKIQTAVARLYCYAVKPITVKFTIKADCMYLHKNNQNKIEEIRKSVAVHSSYLLTADLNNVEYKKGGFATMKPINKCITGSKVKEIIRQHTAGESGTDKDMDIRAKNNPNFEVTNIRITDTYITDDDGNTITPSTGGNHSENGSIIIDTLKDQQNTNIYIRGIPNLQLYTYEIKKEKTFDGFSEDNVLFTDEEMHGALTNVIDGSEYDGSGTEVKYILETNGDEDGFSTSEDDSSNNGITITNNKVYKSDTVHYDFDMEKCFATYSYIDLLPDIDVNDNYTFVTNITLLNGEDDTVEPNVYWKAKQKIHEGDQLIDSGSPYLDCSYESRMYGVERTGYDYYPKQDEDPIHGTVNGNESNIFSQNGKETYFIRLYKFPLDSGWYNIQYGIELVDDEVTPSAAKGTISYVFPSQENITTNLEEDLCIFDSSYHTQKKIEYIKNVASYYSEERIVDNNKNIFTYKIPYTDINNNLGLIVEVIKNNEGVVVTDKNIAINSSDKTFDVAIELQAYHHPSFKWSPSIHNGYYYFNQYENYIYNKTDITADKTLLKQKYKNIEVILQLEITLNNGNTLSKNIAKYIKADKTYYTIIEDLDEYIKDFLENNSLKKYDMQSYNIAKIYGDFVFTENYNKVQCKSNDYEIEYYSDNYFDIKDNTITVSPIPKQFSPITIVSNDGNTFINIAELNDTNVLDITENYIIKEKTYTILTKYNNIELVSVKVNKTEMKEDCTVINNSISFNEELIEGDKVCVIYKIKDSYIVNYDIKNDNITIKFNTNLDLSNTYINYEVCDDDAYKLIDHLSLNPIHNTHYDGFIYITDEFKDGYYLNIYQTDKYLFYDSHDRTRIFIELLDNDRNPIENETIDISCLSGKIKYETNITDINGVIAIEYYAESLGTDTITVKYKDLTNTSKIFIEERVL